MNDDASVAKALSALGHEGRLTVFRLLVRAGEPGLGVGEIGAHVGMPPSTLAHHLSALVDAGLVRQERKGRNVVNRTDYAAMHAILDFLTEECCVGVGKREEEKVE